MPVRFIEDKNVRIQLSQLDQTSAQALFELAKEVRESGGEDPEGDARRILREVVLLQPDHAAAQTLLATLE